MIEVDPRKIKGRQRKLWRIYVFFCAYAIIIGYTWLLSEGITHRVITPELIIATVGLIGFSIFFASRKDKAKIW